MSLIKESSLYMVGRGIPALISFVAIVVYTHLLEPEEYGYFSLVVVSVALFNSVFFHWLRFGLSRFRVRYEHKEIDFLSVIFFTFILLLVITGLIGVLAWQVLSNEIWQGLILVAVLVLWGQAWAELNLELLRSRFKAWHYSALSVLKAGFALLLGVVLIRYGFGEYGPLIGLVIATLLSTFIVSRKAWVDVKLKLAKQETVKELLRYGLPLSATAIFAFVVSSTDRFMIASILGVDKAGMYAPSYDIAQQSLGIMMLAIYLAGFPRIVSTLEGENKNEVQKKLKAYFSLFLTIALPAVVGFMVLAPNIATVLLGEAYQQSAMNIMPIIAIATLFSGIKAYYLDMSFQLSEVTVALIWIAAVSAVVNVILNILWIPVYGLEGAAYATLISYVVSAALSLYFGRQKMKIPLFSKSIIKIGVSLFVIIVVIMYLPVPEVVIGGLLGLIYQGCVVVVVYSLTLYITHYLL